MKNKSGYTLTEIITVAAILTGLAVFVVPNYLRIKTNVDIELVKQNLRVIGEEMGEEYNQKRRFPTLDEILNGKSQEELAITASLNAIENKNYETKYTVLQDRSNYVLRVDPKFGPNIISGDKCFISDLMGFRELPCWSGEGINFAFTGSTDPWTFRTFDDFFSDRVVTDTEKEIITGLLEIWAYNSWPIPDFDQKADNFIVPKDRVMGMLFYLTPQQVDLFKKSFSGLSDNLKKMGIKTYLNPADLGGDTVSWSPDGGGPQTPIVRMQVGFTLADPSISHEDARSILYASKPYQAYMEWSSRNA